MVYDEIKDILEPITYSKDKRKDIIESMWLINDVLASLFYQDVD